MNKRDYRFLHMFCALLLVLCQYRTKAQVLIPDYTFAQETGGTYVPITDSTMIAHGAGLTNQTYPLTLPFTFNLDNTDYTDIYVGVNGYISFGTTNPGTGYWMLASSSTGFRVISGFDTDLASSNTNTTDLSYKVTGFAPNRKFIVQWSNFGYNGTNIMNVNFQIILNEGTNLIEMSYGNTTLGGSSSNISVQVGLRGLNNTVYFNRSGYSGSWWNTMEGSGASANIVYQSNSNLTPGIKFKFIAPPYCTAPDQPGNLVLNPGLNNVNISYTGPAVSPSGYLIIRTPGSAPLTAFPVNGTTYTSGNTIGNGTIVYKGTASSYNNTGLSQQTNYTYTVVPYKTGTCIGGPTYNTLGMLSGLVQTAGPKTYTWLPATGSANWTVSTNWSPERTTPLAGDTLVFNNGGTVTASNIPTQAINNLVVTGNTQVTLNSNTTTNRTLTINNLLRVDTGAYLSLGADSTTLAFATTGAAKTASIYGGMSLNGLGIFKSANAVVTVNAPLTLNGNSSFVATSGQNQINSKLIINDNAAYNATLGTTILNDSVNLYTNGKLTTVSAQNSSTVVTVNASVNAYGAGAAFSKDGQGSYYANFTSGSSYNHLRDGGATPRARMDLNSTMRITGITATALLISDMPRIGNFIWDCPGQSTTIVATGTGIDTVSGHFSVLNTGTYPLQLGGSTVVLGEFIQQNSTLKMSSGVGFKLMGNTNLISGVLDVTGSQGLNVMSNLNQSAAHMITNSSTSQAGGILFTGSAHQYVTIGGTIGAGSINYTLDNKSGVTLTGTVQVHATVYIKAGHFSGPGGFAYDPSAGLNYTLDSTYYCSPQEWPAVNSPSRVDIEIDNVYPNNLLYMPDGDRSVQALRLYEGIVVLGSSNLFHTGIYNSFYFDQSGAAYPMIATNGTGSFFRRLGINDNLGQYYNYPICDLSGVPEFSMVQLLCQTTANHNVGINVKDMKHPADLSTTGYLSRYWKFIDYDSLAAPITYKAKFTYNANDVNGTGFELNRWDGNNWYNLPFQIVSSSYGPQLTSYNAPLITTQHPLNNNVFTGRPGSLLLYTWNGSVNNEYLEPLNWTPARNVRTPGDFLQFNNGANDTVVNIPDDMIRGLRCINNTNIVLKPGPAVNTYSPYGPELSMVSDMDETTNELFVDSTSSLTIQATDVQIYLRLEGDSCNGRIDGRVEISSSLNKSATLNIGNASSVLQVYGKLVNSGQTGIGGVGGLDTNNIVINGIYEHKYTISGGVLPKAIWKDGSTCLISSYTTTPPTGSISGPIVSVPTQYQGFYKFVYDCPNQTNILEWSIPNMVVRDSFIIRSTGTGKLNLKNAYDFRINHFRQDAGLFVLTQGGIGDTMTITGSFQEFGTLAAPGATATNTRPMLNFAGTTGAQLVSFHNTVPAGGINYRINNTQGIQLNGTGSLGNYFDVDTLGSFIIAKAINSPVSSTMKIRYRENAGLTFEAKADITPDSLIFPAANGPQILKINVGTNNRVIMPGSRSIAKEVNMQSGDIDIDTTNLTIGQSAAIPGKLTYNVNNAGTMRLTTGSLSRWYGISALPTGPETGQTTAGAPGYYPISSGQHRRAVSLYFSTSTALSAGGTITVSHDAAQGLTSGLSIADGAATITDRTNASWSFAAGNGLTVANGSFGIRLTGGDLITVNNFASLRISQANAVAGTHVNGVGSNPNPMASRSGLSLTELTAAPYYLAAPANVILSDFISITDGNWNTPSTWNKNSVPTATDLVYISIGDTVTVDAAAAAKVVYVNKGAMLNSIAGTLVVSDSIANTKGTVAINGGTITLGPVGGGRSRFTSTGLLDVTAGNLNVNGSAALLQGDYDNVAGAYTGALKQSGGIIRIDGNAAGIAANSVLYETTILQISLANINATGGTLMVVDPHASVWGTTVSYSGSTIAHFDKGHSFILGDGVSTDPGAANNGFSISGSPWFGTLIVNGSPSGVGREVVHGNGITRVNGDLIINNANGNYKPDDIDIYGNLTVNAGATIKLFDSEVIFRDDSVSTTPALVSGAGTLAANSSGVQVKILGNANPRGLILDIGDVKVSGAFKFIKGVITMANNAILKSLHSGNGENATQATGWINGKLLRGFNGTMSSTMNFPVGDLNTCGAFSVTAGSWAPSSTETYLRGYSIAGDHPSIAGSGIDAAKNVNRIYVIDSVDAGISVTNFTVTPYWPDNIVDPGAMWLYFNGARYYNNSWTVGSPTALTQNKMGIAGLGNQLYGQYIVGEASGSGTITQQPSPYTTCSGTQASFSVQATMTNNYQWQVNTGSGWNNLNNDNNYSGATTNALLIPVVSPTMNGYQFRCLAGNYTDTAISATATLSVNTSVAASVSISTASNTTLCAGTPVSFSATPVNGGTNPVYQWKINGVNTGSNNSTLNVASLNNNDVVTCQLTSSSGCAVPAVVLSNAITFNITPLITPTLSIAVFPGTTICGSSMPTFTATAVNAGSNPEYQWTRNGSTVSGATSSTYTPTVLNDNDQIRCYIQPVGICSAVSSVFSNIITMDVTTPVNAYISITSSSPMPLCAGAPATFTATVSNAGTSPSYQWKRNGNNVGTNSNSFTDATLASGDVVTCVLTVVPGTTCYASTTVNSNSITISTISSVTPVVTVAAVPGTSVCTGQGVTFNATITGGGANPVYQWKKNGSNVGTNNAAYSDVTLANGDVVNCTVTHSNSCYLAASSNSLTMTVTQSVTPAVSISTPQTSLCNSNSATFTATPTNGGAAATYQWKKNGINVGTNSTTYSDAALLNGDVITCVMNSSLACLTQAAATSNAVVITINTPATPSVSISTPQSTICNATNAVFTAVAVNGGTNPVYQWKKNGSSVGSNSGTYADAALVNGDVISCVLTSNASCISTTSATSNSISMTVTPTVTASIAIAASQTTICSGTSVTFTATPVNGGTTPVYQWKKNGSNVGTNSVTYTDAALANGDLVTCTLTSNASCVAVAGVVSNSVSMTVTPTVTASVVISASQTSICPSTLVTFTANATNGGTTPVYQWKKNNINVGTNSNIYTDAGLNNNDVIVCQVTSNANCVTTATVTSNEVTITVNPILIPSITISAATTDVCESNPEATLNASVVNGGTAPVYQWKKNGVNVGTNSSGYTDPALATGDVITCELTSNATCASTSAVNSNAVTFNVNPSPSISISETICEGQSYTFGTQVLTAAGNYTEVWNTAAGCDSTVHLSLTVSSQVQPSVSISANPGTTVNNGQNVVFSATVTNGGTAPAITWKKNNITIAGATGLSWQGIAGTNFVNGDKISASLQSNAPCASANPVESAKLTMTINSVGINEHERPGDFELFPNPTTGKVTVKALKNAGRVEVMDMLGRKLYELRYNAGEAFDISLDNFAAGPYSLLFIDSKGNRWHIKVIRE